MSGNGAGTGIVRTYQAVRLLRARRLGLTACFAVAAGTATTLTARLLAVATAARPSGTTATASALFAPRSSPIWRGSRKKA